MTNVALLAAVNAGPVAYNVTYTTAGPCINDSTITLVISPPTDPAFTFSRTSYCISYPDTVPLTLTNPGGRFYTIPPAHPLLLNTTTGEIRPANGTVGTTVDVCYESPGRCSDTLCTTISIDLLDNVFFEYDTTAYCTGLVTQPMPVSTSMGTAFVTGTFTVNPNLIGGMQVNAITGALTIGNIPGNYWIYNTTTGFCANVDSTLITALAPDDSTFSYGPGMDTFCLATATFGPVAIITGVPGGTFSINGTAVINPVTGVIDLGASPDAGQFNVTYTTPGPCPTTAFFTVWLRNPDVATFNYISPNYCQGFTNICPAIATIPTAWIGTFTITPAAPAGFLNPTTGCINPSLGILGTTYIITHTTNGPCPNTFTDSVTISPIDAPVLEYNMGDSLVCQNNGVIFPTIATPMPITRPFHMFISIPNVSVAFLDPTTGRIDPTQGALGSCYDIVYITGDTCTGSDTFRICITDRVNGLFNYNGATVFCNNSPITIDAILDDNAYSAVDVFTATAPLAIDAGTGSFDPASVPPGMYNIIRTISGIACPTVETLVVNIVAEPDATILQPDSFCFGATAQQMVAATPGGTFSGIGVTLVGGIYYFDPAGLAAGQYQVFYQVGDTATNCFDSSSAIIYIEPLPSPLVDFYPLICIGDTNVFSFIGTQPLSDFEWNFDLLNEQSISGFGMSQYYVVWDEPGRVSFNLSVTGINGCQYDSTYFIDVVGVQLSTIDDVTINYGEDVILYTTTNPTRNQYMTFNWVPDYNLSCSDCANPVAAPLKPTTYFVSVTDTNGCISFDTVNVDVFVDKDLYIPNAFTPNRDGNNDRFEVYGKGFESVNIAVYSRWGEKVFETDDMTVGWNGSFKGQPLNPAVYEYVVSVTYLDETTEIRAGNVTLIR